MKRSMLFSTLLAAGLAALPSTASAAGAALGVNMAQNETGGAVVTGIYPGSPASAAGLRIGDRIVSFGGRTVHNYKDVIGLLSIAEPNTTVQIGVNRLGWERALPATLAAPRMVFEVQPTTAVSQPAIQVQRRIGEEPSWTPADIDDQHGYGSS
ncbi:MAG TPA: PDZ domain-containing protein [Pirellulales bacterium]|nr:PDZ domain-containing protein [Pirellulales bacterium]